MKKMIEKNRKLSMFLAILAAIISLGADFGIYFLTRPRQSTYHEYIEALEAGYDIVDEQGRVIEIIPDLIDTVYYPESGETWRYTLWTEDSRAKYEAWIAAGKDAAKFKYNYSKNDWRYFEMPHFTVDFLTSHMEKYEGISFRKLQARDFDPIFLQVLPMFLTTAITFGGMMLFFSFYMKKMTQTGGIGHDLLVKDTRIRFDDVIGHEEVVEELKLIVSLMQACKEKAEHKNNNRLDRFHANIPKGILFSGAPGTGKTLLAKALAGEAGVPFLYMNASEFIEQYVGVGAKRVRELFKNARKNAPCIIFLDEIDAVGTDRSVATTGEQKQTINALLQEMDGFDTKSGVFIIAATNTPDTLDKALVRSGRFDRQIVVNPPANRETRKKIFELYLKDDPYDADLDMICEQCTGFTGADINTICNEARLIAITQDAECITTEILEEAIDRKIFKGNRKKEDNERDKRIVATHEAGHALISKILGVPIARATIIGNTGGVGGAVFKKDDDKKLMSKEDLKNAVMIAYGGRAAEEIVFGEENITTGASNDIDQATSLLKQYVGRYGFDEYKFSCFNLFEEKKAFINRHLFDSIDDLSKELYDDTLFQIRACKSSLNLLSLKLYEKETLSGTDIDELLNESLEKDLKKFEAELSKKQSEKRNSSIPLSAIQQN